MDNRPAVAALREALKTYGQHRVGCPHPSCPDCRTHTMAASKTPGYSYCTRCGRGSIPTSNEICDCGFEVALAIDSGAALEAPERCTCSAFLHDPDCPERGEAGTLLQDKHIGPHSGSPLYNPACPVCNTTRSATAELSLANVNAPRVSDLPYEQRLEIAQRICPELYRALEESVKLQSHYARLLNMDDGGTRSQFDAERWLKRLYSLRLGNDKTT